MDRYEPFKKGYGTPKDVFERARTSILHEDDAPEWERYHKKENGREPHHYW